MQSKLTIVNLDCRFLLFKSRIKQPIHRGFPLIKPALGSVVVDNPAEFRRRLFQVFISPGGVDEADLFFDPAEPLLEFATVRR